uniref:Ig-like domain-containing protein n=1 Tax=Heterorhabditis bacteriophora TaxID=37862 RepID=A0A1I7XMV2_HETBA
MDMQGTYRNATNMTQEATLLVASAGTSNNPFTCSVSPWGRQPSNWVSTTLISTNYNALNLFQVVYVYIENFKQLINNKMQISAFYDLERFARRREI